MTQLTFCGAAGTVTGSCSLLHSKSANFLVDAGLFQGNKTTRALNYEDFPFDPKSVDFLLLTHAHIDHSGLLPKLVKHGFQGPIYATEASVDLLEFMLLDGASIQESSAERTNRKRARRGQPLVEPLYTEADAKETLERLQSCAYERWFEPTQGVRVRYWNAGHILGSASAQIELTDPETEEKLDLLFSGDIGPEHKVFHLEADAPQGFDYIISESTYGDRERADYTLESRREALRQELTAGLERGGNVVIPSFAVERSQELIHDIGYLSSHGQIPPAEIYLDSPLAKKVTEVFIRHSQSLEDIDVEANELFSQSNFHMVESVEESKAVNQIDGGAIIISASGMCDAGRIQHHLKANLWKKDSTVLFVGFQSPGTLGHIIQRGAHAVRIHGQEIRVQAQVRTIGNYSAHADQSELVDWITERMPIRAGLFLNHGDDEARATLKKLLVERGIKQENIHMPSFDQCYELSPAAADARALPEQLNGRNQAELSSHDWHNEFALLQLELSARLQNTTTGTERLKLLQRLRELVQDGAGT